LSRIHIDISGLALGFPEPALVGPGRHICVPANIGGAGVDSSTPWPAYAFFWPRFACMGRHLSISASFGRDTQVLGQIPPPHFGWTGAQQFRLGRREADSGWAGASPAPAGPASLQSWLGRHRANPGWAVFSLAPAGPAAPPFPAGPARCSSRLGWRPKSWPGPVLASWLGQFRLGHRPSRPCRAHFHWAKVAPGRPTPARLHVQVSIIKTEPLALFWFSPPFLQL
jgi:hypothetical protein